MSNTKGIRLATPQCYKVRSTLLDIHEQLKTQVDVFYALTEGKLETISNELLDKQEELENLELQLTETKRQKTLDLKLAMQENERNAMLDIAAKLGFKCVKQEEYDELVKATEESEKKLILEIESLKAKHAKAISAAVNQKELELTSAHKVETAQAAATIDSQKQKVEFLTERVDQLSGMLDKAQANVVAVAEAGNRSINVTAPK
jgi:electron transfer flavoprotein alpha subunit